MKFYIHLSRMRTYEGWKDVIEFVWTNDPPFPTLPVINPRMFIDNRPQA